VFETIDVELDDWSQVVPLIGFIRGCGLSAYPMLPPARGVRIQAATTDTSGTEIFAALHSWLEVGGSDELRVTAGDWTWTMPGGSATLRHPDGIGASADEGGRGT
jgi:hypothetical protein